MTTPKPIFLIEYPSHFTGKSGDEMAAEFRRTLKGYHVIFITKDIEEINFKFN